MVQRIIPSPAIHLLALTSVLLFGSFLFGLIAAMNAMAQAEGLPPGFQDELVSNFDFLPTAVAFNPDGRIFLTTKGGQVWVIENGVVLPAPFLTLNVSEEVERGLLGIAIDPNFATSRALYLYYTTGPDSLEYSGNPKNRVSRFLADEFNSNFAEANSEVILLDDIPSESGFHNAGCLRIGLDGKIYVSVGDNIGQPNPAQDLGSLAGKILRLDLDGTIPDDNPFINQPGKRGEIWAYGLRNPWRFTVQPETGALIIGDVGQSTWEEINWGGAGANYRWPLKEGPEPAGVPGVTYPIYAYMHDDPDHQGASVTGGVVYEGSQFPPEYEGNYFFADYIQGIMWRMILDERNRVADVREFATGLSEFITPTPGLDSRAGIVDFALGPDGSLYYIRILDFFPRSGDLHKISFVGSDNRLPVAKASATPTSGLLPLTVTFSSEGSSDPDGDPLSFLWDFGDGNVSTVANPTHTYNIKGVFKAVLTVSDSKGGEARTVPMTIHAGNQAASVTISSPQHGSLYNASDVISYAGSATDPEDGELDATTFSWTVLFHHINHIHPFIGPINGFPSGEFTIPTQGEPSADTWYEILLTVTDSEGLSQRESVTILPQKFTVTLTTSPMGLQIFLDGSPQTTPTSFEGVVGFLRELSAPSPQILNGVSYLFDGWSDGGTQTHIIATPSSDTTFTAFFGAPSATLGPANLPSNATAGSTNVPLIQFQLKAVADHLAVESMSIRIVGTTIPTSLGTVKLWADANGDGQGDVAETMLVTGAFDARGEVTLLGSPMFVVPEGQIQTFLVTVDVPTSVAFRSSVTPFQSKEKITSNPLWPWVVLMTLLVTSLSLLPYWWQSSRSAFIRRVAPASVVIILLLTLSSCGGDTPPTSGTLSATIPGGSIHAVGVETNAVITLPATNLAGPTVTVTK